MINPNDALDRLRRANSVPATAKLDGDELAAAVGECERRIAVQRGAAGGRPQSTEGFPPPVRHPWHRWRPVLIFSLVFVAVTAVVGMVALFDGSTGSAPDQDVVSNPAQLTTTLPSVTTLPIRIFGGVASVEDLEYYADGERVLETSVFFPAEGDGPWPVVVVYSEFLLGKQSDGLARRIADRGAVVFAPVWADATPPALSGSEYLSGAMWDRAACAVGYAQAQADTFGGDLLRTTVIGQGGGEHPATWAALGLANTNECPEPIRHQPTGLVAGESQWLFQEESFNAVFIAVDSIASDTVDLFFNPERWDTADDLSVLLWSTSWSGNSNEIENPPAEDSWIWSRDPTGAIVEDLATVGAFDDELITLRDNSWLMELRMARAGIDVTHVEEAETLSVIVNLDEIWSLISGE